MLKPVITFMFKGLANGLLQKLFSHWGWIYFLRYFFPWVGIYLFVKGGIYFLLQVIYSLIQRGCFVNSGRMSFELRRDLWLYCGTIYIIVFFYRGCVFVERGFIWFTGISTPSPGIHRHWTRQPSGCKASWEKERIHGEMDEIDPDHGQV